MKSRIVVCLGNASHIKAWSGTPHFFYQAGLTRQWLTDAPDLTDPLYKWHRTVWSFSQLLQGRKGRGYQYSLECAQRMWDLLKPEHQAGEIISHFQTFSNVGFNNSSKAKFNYYCDATLTQLWDVKSGHYPFGKKQTLEILYREKEGYQHADRLIAMSRACAESYRDDYQIPASKIKVIRPGANLDENIVRLHLSEPRNNVPRFREFNKNNPFCLGFIGMEYQRKGLLRLIKIAEILNSEKLPVIVSIIGRCPESLLKHPLIRYHGQVDKSSDQKRFLSILDSFSVGCLLSYSEPLGISTLECLRLGIPVLGTNVGGIPDCIEDDYGLLVETSDSESTMAEKIRDKFFDYSNYRKLCQAAEREMLNVTWHKVIDNFICHWSATDTDKR